MSETRRVGRPPTGGSDRPRDENLQHLRKVWGELLDGVLDDPAEIDAIIATLQRIETKLVTRSRRRGAAGLSA